MGGRRRLRVGVVGCGYQGALLADAIARTDNLVVTACADPDIARAQAVSRRSGHEQAFSSIDDLLSHDLVDAVVVATPHHVLAATAVSALRAGKHVLVEKPVAVDAQQLAELQRALDDTGLTCMAGYSLRFVPAHRRLHDLLAAGTVGEIQAVTAGIGWQPLTGWRAAPETGGGALLYLGSHLVDAVLAVVRDEPEEVYANVARTAGTAADETAAFQIRFRRGAVAQCLVTQAADEWFDHLQIYGRDGRVLLAASYWLQYTLQVSSNTLAPYDEPTTICPRLAEDPIMMMLVPEVAEFGEAIAAGRPPAVTVADARRVLEVLDAVVSSAEAGAPVRLPVPAR